MWANGQWQLRGPGRQEQNSAEGAECWYMRIMGEKLLTLKDTGCGVGVFWKTEIVAGPETDAQFHFTGIRKYFNSYTLTGRMYCVLATYGSIALLVLYFKLRSKKTPAVKPT
ncbi:ATP synthase membrane subunit K, mitochondrial-like [Camelus dromedarius]|uniref:ATP synthase membrane subunit K, mitochondrial-like n=1 Tax=Camelus dromedarius TaxID=9838 RepID=UPI00311949F3